MGTASRRRVERHCHSSPLPSLLAKGVNESHNTRPRTLALPPDCRGLPALPPRTRAGGGAHRSRGSSSATVLTRAARRRFAAGRWGAGASGVPCRPSSSAGRGTRRRLVQGPLPPRRASWSGPGTFPRGPPRGSSTVCGLPPSSATSGGAPSGLRLRGRPSRNRAWPVGARGCLQ